MVANWLKIWRIWSACIDFEQENWIWCKDIIIITLNGSFENINQLLFAYVDKILALEIWQIMDCKFWHRNSQDILLILNTFISNWLSILSLSIAYSLCSTNEVTDKGIEVLISGVTRHLTHLRQLDLNISG